MSEHVIHVKGDGVLDSTTTADIDEIVRRGLELGQIVVHLHGGLVPESGGRATAQRLAPEYAQAGHYPVFFVYETGLLQTLGNNLHEINAEKLFRKLLKKVLKYAVGKLGGPAGKSVSTLSVPTEISVTREVNRASVDQEPYADFEIADEIADLSDEQQRQFLDELSQDARLQEILQEVVNGATPEASGEVVSSKGIVVLTRNSSESLLSPDVLDELVVDASAKEGKGVLSTARFLTRVVKVLWRVVRRFRTKRDHGLHATVVEEILRELYLDNVGRFVWERMKKDTSDTFENVGAESVRGGWYFVRRLGEALAEADPRPTVSVVAHSLGSVFACNLIDHLAQARENPAHPLPDDFTLDRLVFLAPAVTFARFDETLRRNSSLFDHFRMFALSDEKEAGYWEIPVVYPRSLLYLVSGLAERKDDGSSASDRPLVGMQRYWDRTEVYDQTAIRHTREFLASDQRDAYWSVVDDGPGRATDAVRHGGLDDTTGRRKTFDSVLHFLQE